MKAYTNTLADHIAYLTMLTLQTAYRGDELILSGHNLAYQQNDGVIIRITLDDTRFPSGIYDIQHAIEGDVGQHRWRDEAALPAAGQHGSAGKVAVEQHL